MNYEFGLSSEAKTLSGSIFVVEDNVSTLIRNVTEF